MKCLPSCSGRRHLFCFITDSWWYGARPTPTDVSTIYLTEYVIMSGTTFVNNSTDAASRSYYTLNHGFHKLSGSILFFLVEEMLDALKYFHLCKLASQLNTDPITTAMAFHRYGEIYWHCADVQ